VTRNQSRVTRYLQNLHTEIDLQAELFSPERKVEQLHFGGGTPTYLNEPQLDALMAKLRDAFNFDDSDEHEFSIEVDPRTVSPRSIGELAGAGFNRLSLGVQDFNASVQAAVNRMQSEAEVAAIVEAARNTGFRSISFDLIYGLPQQNQATFDDTLDTVIRMRPDRLAVYNYAHLPERFKGQRMIDADQLPSAQTKLDILKHTIEKLDAAGYVYIGMDHFALPEDDLVTARHDHSLQRNFQGYSTHRRCDLIGLGASSIGSIGRTFAQNAVTTMDYEALLTAGQLPIVKGLIVDDDDQLRASVIQLLMCYDRVDFDDFDATHNVVFSDYFAAEIDRLGALAADGLINVGGDAIEVTAKGRLLLRSIAMVFDRHITEEHLGKRFSKAI
jgi:oxygen-independent coproporphyrinogen-3 oxidase